MAATPPVTSSSELLSAYRTTAAGAKLAELLGQQAGFHRNLNVHPDAKAGSRFALQPRAHHPLPLIICLLSFAHRDGNGTRSATTGKLTMAGMTKVGNVLAWHVSGGWLCVHAAASRAAGAICRRQSDETLQPEFVSPAPRPPLPPHSLLHRAG